MRRIIIASHLAVALLSGITVWLYMNWKSPETATTAERKGEGQPIDISAKHVEHKKKAAWAFDLPMKIAFMGGDQFRPCYFDVGNKCLYLWNEVVLRRDQLPEAYTGRISRIRLLYAKNFSQVVTISPPVKYREINGQYRPGYFQPGVFFEWKGVSVSREKVIPRSMDGKNAVVPLDAVSQVIEIDIPPYMKDHPRLWSAP